MATSTIKIPDAFVKLILLTNGHLGGTKVSKELQKYVYGTRRPEGINIIDIEAMWDKFVLAARAFCALKYPSDVTISSSREFGKRPVVKFCESTGASSTIGRFIPGSFTNSQVKKTYDPRLVIVSDTYADRQAVLECSMVNIPCIAFANTDNSIKGVDIVIPMNNRSPSAIGAGFFILSRIVEYMKTGAEMDRDMNEVELFFFRDAHELEELAIEQGLIDPTDLVQDGTLEGEEQIPVESGAGWGDYE